MTGPPANPEALLSDLLGLAPEARVDRIRAAGAIDDIMLAVGEVVAQLASIDLDRARVANTMYDDLATALGSTAAQARSRWSRARMCANEGRFTDALDLAREATTLAERHGHDIEAARARVASMQPLGELGRLDEALDAGRVASDRLLALGERRLGGLAAINLGIVSNRADRPEEALEHFDRAEAALRDHPEWIGNLWINRGEVLVVLGRYREAETAYRTALDHLDARGESWLGALAEGNLAELAMRQGRLHEALYHFERARRRFEAQSAPAPLARLLAEQAEAKAMLGLSAEALRDNAAALPQLDANGQVQDAGRARLERARLLLHLRRPDEIGTLLDDAAAAFTTLGHSTSLARVRLLEAERRLLADDGAGAMAIITEAQRTLIARPVEQAYAALLAGRASLAQGDLDGAIVATTAGLEAARELGLATFIADLLAARADAHRRRGDVSAARTDLGEAIAHVERIRGTLQADRFRSAYLGHHLPIYETLVALLLDRATHDAIAEAFAVAEQARSRSLLDLVRRAIDYALDAAPADERERELHDEMRALRGEINALYSELDDRPEDGTRRPRAGWSVAVADRERRLQAIESRISATRGVAGLYAPPVTHARACDLARDGTAILAYFSAGDELLAFVLRDGGSRVYRRLASLPEVRDCVARLHFQITRALRPGAMPAWKAARLLDDQRAELERAEALLLRPLRADLSDVRRLIVIPHGPLHLVPMPALHDGQGYLVESHEVCSAPSVSLLAHLQELDEGDEATAHRVVAGVADDAAPEIADEVRTIGRRLDADTILLNDDATVDAVVGAAASAGIVHLACHGRFDPNLPLDSGIRLADRWLTVRDLYAMRWTASLVTLSGCETGRGTVHGGDELVGMQRGFFAAGVRSLLVSLWRVDDASTRTLMDRFYDTWLGADGRPRMDKATALRRAQLDMLSEHRHPAAWAPFILVGRS